MRITLTKTLSNAALAIGLGVSLGAQASALDRDFAPRVSPDGRWVAFYSYRDDPTPDLYLLDLETRSETNLSQTPDNWEIEPAWSADGRHLLFGSGPGMPELRPGWLGVEHGQAVHVDARAQQAPLGMKRSAIWDDQRGILFVQEYGLPARQRLAVLPHDGPSEPLLDLPEGSDFAAPLLSPDRQFVMLRRTQNSRSDLVLISLADGGLRELTASPQEEEYYNWSHDSQWVTWSEPVEPGGRRIFGLQLDEEFQPVAPPPGN